MASGGALFSNYQVEVAEFFRDGEDCIMYYSLEDAFEKAVFYLEHEETVKKIAQNGHDIVLKEFTFESRLKNMLDML